MNKTIDKEVNTDRYKIAYDTDTRKDNVKVYRFYLIDDFDTGFEENLHYPCLLTTCEQELADYFIDKLKAEYILEQCYYSDSVITKKEDINTVYNFIEQKEVVACSQYIQNNNASFISVKDIQKISQSMMNLGIGFSPIEFAQMCQEVEEHLEIADIKTYAGDVQYIDY